MISVEEAFTYIIQHFQPLAAEQVDLLAALDRVLAQDAVSPANVPPFANSAMDGYAVITADIARASGEQPVTLQVIGDVAAGYVATRAVEPGTALRIMTGAPVPPGADTVVRFEDTSEGTPARGTGQERASVAIHKAIRRGDNIRAAGEDIRAGEVVFPRGTVVRAAEIGVLASLGYARVAVHRRPRVAILATGDELVAIDEPVTPGKIRNSNEYSNTAAVLKCGGVPVRLGIARDNIADLTAKIRAGLDAGVDLFLTSAGVSVGDYDIVKDVLNAEGAMHFWQVRMKPGKPLAFGILRGKDGQAVPLLGLPGNPVSAMMSFEVFARPAILTMLGKTKLARHTVRASVQEEIVNDSGRRNFIRVVVEKRGEEYIARSTGEQGSGILTSIARANGLLIVPEDMALVRAGDVLPVQLIDLAEW